MKNINITLFSFTKGDLSCVSDDEATFFLQIGGLIHEVISLQKFIHMSSHGVDDDAQRMAENAQAMYFYRLLAGTIYEGWSLITKRHNEYKIIIAKYKPQLDFIASEGIKKLEEYFSNKDNICEKIRNNFSHHNNYGEILKMFRKWPDGDKFNVYLAPKHANCRYIASDIVTNLAILGTTDIEEIKVKLDIFVRDILDISRTFIDVISEYLSLIFQRVVKEKNIKGKETRIESVPSLDEMRLHYFVADPDS